MPCIAAAASSARHLGTSPICALHRRARDGLHAARDDVPISAVMANDTAYAYRRSTVASGLANTTHTATLTCASPQCDVEYFDALCM
jgi:hypothetical protein